MSETSKSFRKSFECFFCSYESPVGHLVQKLLCFQPEYKFADFFIAMIKKIKEEIKISVCTINAFYPCCGR